MLRTFSAQDAELDEEDPWSGILAATAFAVHSTVHTALQASPMQLVFGHDAMLNVTHAANWKHIQDRKQKLIHINNIRENKKRKEHTHAPGQLALVKQEQSTKHGTDCCAGPATVVKVNDNGTLRARHGSIVDTYNIRNIAPCLQ